MPTILSISSRVVRGTVGNTLAAFVLQRIGHTVWDVPTVVWDHHPGFGRPAGLTIDGQQIDSLLADFRAPVLAAQTNCVLSGYFASSEQIDAVHDHVRLLRDQGHNSTYVCDPVCGDAPGAYVPAAVLQHLRTKLVPLADVLTPNRFELGLLTGQPVSSNVEIIAAARALGRPFCLVTSAFGADDTEIANLLVAPGESWVCAAPLQNEAPNGTGDLMTALFAGWLAHGCPPQAALGRATAGVKSVLDITRAAASRELQIVEAQDALSNPDVSLTVTEVRTAKQGARGQ